MSTYCPAGEVRRVDVLEELRGHLASATGVSAIVVEAAACGALGCRRSEPLLRVEVEGGRLRTLCPRHAVEFVREEVEGSDNG